MIIRETTELADRTRKAMITKALKTVDKAQDSNAMMTKFIMCIIVFCIIAGIAFVFVGFFYNKWLWLAEVLMGLLLWHLIKAFTHLSKNNVELIEKATSVFNGVKNQHYLKSRLLKSRPK